ncbi:phage major capsid protein [Catalinimonas sp. 4WD22]|uniref:phage major capsid protein n=1 Tax=Catalinimonas locisalis TaxID=3133978 RepID=UPI003101134A
MKAKDIKALKEQRASLVEMMRAITDKALEEKRNMTAEDEKRWNELDAQVKSINGIIENAQDDLLERAEASNTELRTDNGSYVFNQRNANGETRSINVISSRSRASKADDGMSFGKYARIAKFGPQSDAEERALNSGDENGTSDTIEAVLSANMIDRLRAQMVMNRAGMNTVMLDSNNLKMAKLASGVTFSWRNESELISASEPSFTSVDWSVKNLAALVRVSNETLADSVNIEQALDMELTKGAANFIDAAILTGADAKGFTGIVGMSGIQTIDQGTNGSAIADYSEILDAYQKLFDVDLNEPTASIMSPREWRAYAGLTAGDGQPLMKPQAIQNLPMYQTTAMPVDLTKGTADNASKMIIGDFTQLFLGLRQDVTIRVLNERFADYNETGFLLTFRADVQAYHESAFVVVDGVIPS